MLPTGSQTDKTSIISHPNGGAGMGGGAIANLTILVTTPTPTRTIGQPRARTTSYRYLHRGGDATNLDRGIAMGACPIT
jgi:hypothetical protein